jgi:hypothetical protein
MSTSHRSLERVVMGSRPRHQGGPSCPCYKSFSIDKRQRSIKMLHREDNDYD